MPACTVEALTLYPIKSCQGVDVDALEIQKTGIVGDRSLMLVCNGESITQKEAPGLARVQVTSLEDGRLRLEHPDAGELVHPLRSEGGALATKLHFNDITTRDQGDEAADWFSEALGRSVRLVDLPRPWDRLLPLPEFGLVDGQPQGRFYDVAPVLLTNQATLDDLNGRLQQPVPMDRFRANIVVEGLPAFGEDDFESAATGALRLLRAAPCERCVVITTDQQSGERAKEPLRTLSQYRKREGGYAGGVVFGAYLAVDAAGVLTVGDVLELAGAAAGPG